MDKPSLLALDAFPDLIAALYGVFPEGARHWAPPSWDGVPSEPLTAIEQICHVLDIEVDGYQLRIRRTLNESNPFLPSLDTEALARNRLYSQQDAATVLQKFRDARIETLRLIRTLSAEQLARPAQFEGYGHVTLRSLLHYLCSHDQQHLAGLQWLLGKFYGRAAPQCKQHPAFAGKPVNL
jgi:DinB superfamily